MARVRILSAERVLPDWLYERSANQLFSDRREQTFGLSAHAEVEEDRTFCAERVPEVAER
jgi:hypothetical protein